MNIIINTETDFTLTQLTEYLNKKYKEKKSGKPFTTTDVQMYEVRGGLPKYLGDFSSERINIKPGLHLLRLTENKDKDGE